MSIGRNILIYGMGGAASRLAAIFLVPLYTRSLPIAEYGQLEILLSFFALGTLLIGLQSESAVARDYYEAGERGELTALFWGSLAISVAGGAFLALATSAVTMLGGVPATFVIYLPWLLLMSLAAQIAGIQLVILRFADRAALFAWLSFIDLAAAALSSALFIVVLDMGIEGALAGIIIGKLLVIVIAWPASFNTPGCAKTNATTIRGMLAYAIPTMPSVLLNWLQTTGNRALMAFFFAFSAVAVAGVAIKVAALYAFLAYTFRLAWEPYSFQKLADVANDRAIYQRALIWYLATMFPAATFVSAAAPIIVRILAPAAYAPAAAVVGFFTMAQFWLGAITVLAIGIHGARLTSRLSLVYGIGSVVNVLLLALLARYIGILAVGIGALASGILTAGLAAHFSRKHFAVWFSPSLLVSMMLLSAATATGFYFIYSSTWMGEWGYGAAPVAILIALTVMSITARLIDRCSGCYGLAAMWADIRITLRRTND